MLVILGVVARKESECTPPQVAVDITDLVEIVRLPQHRHEFLKQRLAPGGALPHEPIDGVDMILRQHSRHRVELGGKIKQVEKVIFLTEKAHYPVGVGINIRMPVEHRVERHFEVLKGERLGVIEPRLGIGINRVAIELPRDDIYSLGGQSDINSLRGAAHGEEKAATTDVIIYCQGDIELHIRDLGIAQLTGHLLVVFHIRLVPELIAESGVELSVLPGVILVVGMQPVVVVKHPRKDFLVPDDIVLDFGVGQRQRYGIIPRL